MSLIGTFGSEDACEQAWWIPNGLGQYFERVGTFWKISTSELPVYLHYNIAICYVCDELCVHGGSS